MPQNKTKSFGGFFNGKRVLVTGHTGFKGSWITAWLTNLGASVVGFSIDIPTDPNHFSLLNLEDKITHIIGDVRNYDQVFKVFDEYKPEIVFHMAAQPLVRYSYAEPRLTFETNIMGTVNLMEAARQTATARVIINITSDKCYENMEWDFAYRENDAIGGHDPYSCSKGCAELVTSAYRRSFFSNSSDGNGLKVASVRAGNVVGGGDWALDRIIPDCVRALSNNEFIIVRNPNAIRPWQHVLEPLSGYLLLASLMWENDREYDSAWNFGPTSQSNVTVKEIAELIIREWGEGGWKSPENAGNQPHEANFLKLDCTKANNKLGWYPVIDICKTIQMTTQWYRAYYQGNPNMLDVTLADIDDYTAEALRQKAVWVKES